jgi:glycosyltransferase involved in cell wall biosynthesis
MTADAVGGVWTYALDLAAGLADAGVRTALAVLGPAPSPAQRAAAERIGVALHATGLPLDWAAGTTAAQVEAAAAVLADLARAVGAALVHLNSPALAAAGDYPAPVLGVCHSCLATWWAAAGRGPLPADFRWRSERLRSGMQACDALVAPTAAFARATAAAHGPPLPRVVHNGRRRPPPAALAARSGEAAVFTSGRLWDEGKNVRTLDAAAALTGLPVRAAGPWREPVGPACGVFEHLELLGALAAEEVRDRLRAHRIYASAALYEPFGLGVLEAAQAGCALVLADIPTFRELWEGAALFAATDSPAAFARHFDALAAEPDLAARLGEAARRRAGRYSLEAMTAGTLGLYRRLGLETKRERAA